MGFQDIYIKSTSRILEVYEDSHKKMIESSTVYTKELSLPTETKTEMIVLFRTVIEQDSKVLNALKVSLLMKRIRTSCAKSHNWLLV